MQKFLSSRKWVIGCLYILGIFAVHVFSKTPLSSDELMWSGVVVTTLIGAQGFLDHKFGGSAPDAK